jgi:hypothetical protein
MKKTIYTTALFVSATAFSYATTWNVGATRTYTLPSQVKNLVQDGDTVFFDGGVYLNDPMKWVKKNLVLRGLGTGNNRAKMEWNAGDIPNGKGIWVFEQPGISDSPTIENIIFDGARVSDADGGNGAGIRYQSKNLTIDNCKFVNCQNGILEGIEPTKTSNIIITNTEFYNNGYEVTGSGYSGYEHHIYISDAADTLIVKNCYFHDPRGEANSLKTRAQRSWILNNVIDEGQGQGSWELDIAQGGLTIAIGNTIIQGPNSINHGIIDYGATTNALNDFYFINNTVINKFAGNVRYFAIFPSSGINTFKVYNNIFASIPAASTTWLQGTVSALDSSKNALSSNLSSFGFVNEATGDYHLTATATSAINKGVAAGNASNGYSLTPIFEYVNFASALNPRTIVAGAIDLGAYEYGTVITGLKQFSSVENLFYMYQDNNLNIVTNNNTIPLNIFITDIAGRRVATINNNTNTVVSFNKQLFVAGLYIVTIENNLGEFTTKKISLD